MSRQEVEQTLRWWRDTFDSQPFDPAVRSEPEEDWVFRGRWLNRPEPDGPEGNQQRYILRTRYQTTWTPSWKANGARAKDCEDAQTMPVLAKISLMDALRKSDNLAVMLKEVKTSRHPHEVEIAEYFSSPELRSDPRNHCVPILETLQLPDDTPRRKGPVLVMPLLRAYNDPPFQTVAEAVDFFRQIFEGLQFMHQHNVAHRDCSGGNIMMESTNLFPVPFHPAKTKMRRDFRGPVKPLTRSQNPPKYYLIDFGLSRRYTPEERPPREDIILGRDKTPPEHQGHQDACDPFPTDVYFIGHLIRTDFLEFYSNIDFMDSLSSDMMDVDPTKRPSMDQVVERYARILQGLTPWKLKARLVGRKEWPFEMIVKSASHLARRLFGRSGSEYRPPHPVPA